jgi:hypothetical protein
LRHRLLRPQTLTVLLTLVLTVSLVSLAAALRLPGDNSGYEPVQPIAYSHRLHAGDLKIPCLYCHSSAERGRYAGIPAASVCMNCHRQITATRSAREQETKLAESEKRGARRLVSPELQKLYDALALDGRLVAAKGKVPTPISWVRVHALPDFVRFDHSPHVTAAVACQTCHGPIETMERVRQFSSLSMGWCVNCHRQANEQGINGKPVHAATDCTTCHY